MRRCPRHEPTLTVRADLVDTHQVAIPLSAHLLADQRVRHRVEGAVNLDVSIRMLAAGDDLEQPERLAGKRLQQWLARLPESGAAPADTWRRGCGPGPP